MSWFLLLVYLNYVRILIRYIYRYLCKLKSYVRNKAHAEGSIAEGYLVDECLTFCSRYLHGIKTIFNRPERNDDRCASTCDIPRLSIFSTRGLLFGKHVIQELNNADYHAATFYILQNCEETESFIQ
jgi:hypothetical protein